MSRNSNGSGNIRKKKVTRNGKTYEYWEGRITTGYDPATGKQIQRSITGSTQKEVSQKMRAEQTKLDTKTYIAPTKMFTGDWLDVWLEEYVKPSVKTLTYSTYKDNVTNHIKPRFNKVRLSDLDAQSIQVFCNDLTRINHLAPKTVKNIIGTFHKSLHQAVALKYIPFNPIDSVKTPRTTRKELRPFTEDEIKLFLVKIEGEELCDLLRVALFTGMREGEVCGLPWDAIDFENGTITVKQQLQLSRETKKYFIASTKNDKWRIIPAAPYVMDILKHRKQIQDSDIKKSFGMWNNPWNLVFTYANGSHIPLNTARGTFKRIAKSIGAGEVRFHDMRHTYAVLSLQEGDDVKTVQSNLGHATASFTLDVYGHVSEKMRKESSDRMQDLINKLKPT